MNPLDWSLVDGWLPVAFTLLGLGAVAAIMARRDPMPPIVMVWSASPSSRWSSADRRCQ